MKTVKVKVKIKEQDYTRPGEPMTQDEFDALIKKAEQGPFKDWEQSKKDFEAWKKARKS